MIYAKKLLISFYVNMAKNCTVATFTPIEPQSHYLYHGRPTLLWYRAMPVIVGWFVGRT